MDTGRVSGSTPQRVPDPVKPGNAAAPGARSTLVAQDAFATPLPTRSLLGGEPRRTPVPQQDVGYGVDGLASPQTSGGTTTDPVTGVSIKQGSERWPVKTGTDPDASKVDLTPVPTNVGELNNIPAPSTTQQSSRIVPTEETIYQLTNVHILGIKEEPDGDFHLIVSDDSAGTHTMDVESLQKVDLLATMTGIAFFDRLHGQKGAAANGIELHPLLSIKFLQSPEPPPPPPTSPRARRRPTTASPPAARSAPPSTWRGASS